MADGERLIVEKDLADERRVTAEQRRTIAELRLELARVRQAALHHSMSIHPSSAAVDDCPPQRITRPEQRRLRIVRPDAGYFSVDMAIWLIVGVLMIVMGLALDVDAPTTFVVPVPASRDNTVDAADGSPAASTTIAAPAHGEQPAAEPPPRPAGSAANVLQAVAS